MPPASNRTEPRFDTVVVVGVGLIGGSIAAAARKRGVARRVVGVGRSRERLEAARLHGVLDEIATSGAEVGKADLVILCTPVDRIAGDARRIAAELSGSPILTDAGSVKGTICDDLRATPVTRGRFIGSHPLAGSEKNGWENSDSDLFVDRLCVVTPGEADPPADVARVEEFWKAIGMRVRRMSPAAHDEALAFTSHLPHLVAAALAGSLPEGFQPFAARGFRDTTRVAGGDPELWSAIFEANADAVASSVAIFRKSLDQLAAAVQGRDAAKVRELLLLGQSNRNSLDSGT
jgi:prephenate dehydrogenase